MIRTRNRQIRAAVVTLAVTGALALSACQGEPATESGPSAPPTSTRAPGAQPSSPTSDAAPSTADSSAASSSSSAARPDDTALTPNGSTLKVGQPATFNHGTDSEPDILRLTPQSLTIAPDEVYSEEPRLKKDNGTVYYLRFEVANVKQSSASISTDTIMGIFFHPEFDLGSDGRHFRYDTSECKSPGITLEVGQSGSGCLVFQSSGSPSTNIVYDAYKTKLTWTP